MSTYLSELNDVQRQAVEALEGPVMVIAGAGCGAGICYLEGIGIGQNRNEAIKWLNKAAEQGDEESKNILEKL